MRNGFLSCHNSFLLVSGLRKAALVAALICLAISAVSCRSVNEVVREVPVEIHDTAYISKTVHDSTYIDRWHTIEVKGDTVFLTNNQITVKYRTVTDTAYKYIEKPVEVKISQIKEVEKELNWFQKTMIGLGWCFIVAIIITGMCLYFKLKRKVT